MKPLLKFIPLFLLYLLVVFLFSRDILQADEKRYYDFAENIVNGFYTDPDDPNLMNGPGYPVFLAFFLALDLPLLIPKLVNALLAFLSIVLVYKSLLFFVPKRIATIYSFALGLYIPMIMWIGVLFSDILSLFLISGFMYTVLRCFRKAQLKFVNLLIPALFLGYLILTKVFFAMVVFAAVAGAIICFFFTRNNKVLKFAAILTLGYLIASPYLLYTYSMTGRYFYWSSNGGEQMYWMSSHQDNEYGNWIESTLVLERKIEHMHPDHEELYDYAYTKPWVERNDIFMKEAKKNIRANPGGYVYNVIANSIRLMAGGPRSYLNQSLHPYFFLFINLGLLVPVLLSLIPAWMNKNLIPFEIFGLIGFILIYLGGSVLIAAVQRYLLVTLPILILWIAFINTHFIQLSFLKKKTLPDYSLGKS